MLESFLPSDYPDFNEHGTPLCAQTDPDAFFSEDPLDSAISKRGVYAYEREAKLVCQECPYKVKCLKYALDNPELVGIWGGTNEYQRRSIRKGIFVDLRIPPSRNR